MTISCILCFIIHVMRMLVIFILTPDESGAKGGAGGGKGRGVVLYATQECAQPALFIAPPRYRIHSRQKQPRQTWRRVSVSVVRISLQRFRDFGTNLPYGFFGM